MNSLKMSQILSLDSDLQLSITKNSNQENKLSVACIERQLYLKGINSAIIW